MWQRRPSGVSIAGHSPQTAQYRGPDAEPCAALNPAIASRLQSVVIVGRVSELGRSANNPMSVLMCWHSVLRLQSSRDRFHCNSDARIGAGSRRLDHCFSTRRLAPSPLFGCLAYSRFELLARNYCFRPSAIFPYCPNKNEVRKHCCSSLQFHQRIVATKSALHFPKHKYTIIIYS